MRNSFPLLYVLFIGSLYADSAPFTGIEESPSMPTHAFGFGFHAPTPTISQPEPSLVEEWNEVSDFDARLELVKLLSEKKDSAEEALVRLRILFEQRPEDPALRLLLARIRMTEGCYVEAHELVLEVLESTEKKYLWDAAFIEGDLGHASLSRDLFEEAIASMEEEEEVRMLAYAGMMQSWGEAFHAQQIYIKHLEKNVDDNAVWLNLARSYAGVQRYEEAEQIFLCLLDTAVANQALLGLATLKFQRGDYDAAWGYVEKIEGIKDSLPIKAQLLKKFGEYASAAEAYEELAAKERYPSDVALLYAEAYVAWYQAGCQESAEIALKKAVENDASAVSVRYYAQDEMDQAGSAQELVEWATLYAEDGCADVAIALYDQALELDPDLYPAKVGLAGALAGQLDYRAARVQYAGLVEAFPGNLQHLLWLARVISWQKQYIDSVILYNQLIEADPCNPLYRIEKARVAFWWQFGDLGFATFESLLADNLESIRDTAYLELLARRASWNRRDLEALRYYDELLSYNPGDEAILSDYAQTWCNLGMCEAAQCLYEKIHNIDPQNTIINQALDRHELQMHLGGAGLYDFWTEEGRGGLSAITRHKIRVGLDYPANCQQKWRLLEDIFIDHPFGHEHNFVAQALTLEYQEVYNQRLAAAVSLTEKQGGNYHIRRHFLGTAVVNWRMSDRLAWAVGFERADEFYNYFGLKQDVQSSSFWGKAGLNPMRKLTLEGSYRYQLYTDHNHQQIAQVGGVYQLTEFPTILRIVAQTEWRNTAHLDVLVYSPSGQLINIIHPYWTPQHYYAGRIGMEWYHDLTDISFCGAEKRSYSFRAMYVNDTEGDRGYNCSAETHWDWKHWSLYLTAAIYRQKQWDGTGIWSAFVYRF